MLGKALLSAGFSERLHSSLPVWGFACAELHGARLPAMLIATSPGALAGAQPGRRRCPPPALSNLPNGGAGTSFHAGLPQVGKRVGTSAKFMTLPAVTNTGYTKIGDVSRDGLNIRFAPEMTYIQNEIFPRP